MVPKNIKMVKEIKQTEGMERATTYRKLEFTRQNENNIKKISGYCPWSGQKKRETHEIFQMKELLIFTNYSETISTLTHILFQMINYW